MFKKSSSICFLLFFLSNSPGMAYAWTVGIGDGTYVVQQNGKCTGVVKDVTGETVIGASVVVKGTSNGTITDINGVF